MDRLELELELDSSPWRISTDTGGTISSADLNIVGEGAVNATGCNVFCCGAVNRCSSEFLQ